MAHCAASLASPLLVLCTANRFLFAARTLAVLTGADGVSLALKDWYALSNSSPLPYRHNTYLSHKV